MRAHAAAIGEAEPIPRLVDLIEEKAYTFSGQGMEEKSTAGAIPREMKAAVTARAHPTDGGGRDRRRGPHDEVLAREELTVAEIRRGLCERVVQGDLSPVFCCSAYHNQGVKEVLDEVWHILPSLST